MQFTELLENEKKVFRLVVDKRKFLGLFIEGNAPATMADGWTVLQVLLSF